MSWHNSVNFPSNEVKGKNQTKEKLVPSQERILLLPLKLEFIKVSRQTKILSLHKSFYTKHKRGPT